ncbi:MAG: FAD-binding oxidoreductase, partial [Cyanobium sp.]
ASLAAAAGQGADAGLLIGLASIDAASLEEQAAAIAGRSALPLRPVEAEALAPLLALARGDGSAGWLLRLGVRPDAACHLLEAPELAGLPLDLAAGSGLGTAWAPAAALGVSRVEALRRRCQELGGWLTVLLQPPGAALPAWVDSPARPMIAALKHRFDPLGQLAPGRLPGVATPALMATPASPAAP